MKSRESLIRLKRFQVEEKRRRLSQIETMIAEFDRMAGEALDGLPRLGNVLSFDPVVLSLQLGQQLLGIQMHPAPAQHAVCPSVPYVMRR